MKSLILKDIYNIMHNMKALVLMLFIFLFITIPQGGAAAYVITCCILCAMMVVTTFSFPPSDSGSAEGICRPAHPVKIIARITVP